MMFTDEGLVVAELIQPFDQFQVALLGNRRVLSWRMKRGQKNSEFHLSLLQLTLARGRRAKRCDYPAPLP